MVVGVEAFQAGAGFLDTALATVAAVQLLFKHLPVAAWAWYVSGHILDKQQARLSVQHRHGLIIIIIIIVQFTSCAPIPE